MAFQSVLLLSCLAAAGCGIDPEQAKGGESEAVGESSQADTSTAVIVYQHSNFGGSAQTLAAGSYTGAQLTLGDNAISSLRVPTGWRATLYQFPGFTGPSKVITSDITWLNNNGANWNDLPSSVVVDKISVDVYADGAYGGATQRLLEGRYDIGALTVGNDAISSLTVPPGWRVTLYQNGGFTGSTKVITSDTSMLGSDFNDITSSIVVEAPAYGATGAITALTNQRYVSAANSGASALIADHSTIGPWETFQVTTLGSGYVALRAPSSGKYVSAASSSSNLIADSTTIGSSQVFQWVNLGSGNFALYSTVNSRYVCAEGGGTSPLIANRTAIGPWETFHWTTQTDIASLSKIVIFGDSLSDQQNQWNTTLSGRCPNQAYGYWNGRFTNGYNWLDSFSQDYASIAGKIDNAAVGGAAVITSQLARPNVNDQIDTYLAGLSTSAKQTQLPNSLAVLWGGANDIEYTIESGILPDAVTYGHDVSNALYADYLKLRQNGVTRFVVVSVPQLDQVPVSRTPTWTSNPNAISWAQVAVQTLNTALASWTASEGAAGGVTINYVPVHDFISKWVSGQYTSTAMTDVTNACYAGGACDFSFSSSYFPNDCAGKMFMDYLHPTALAHCLVAGSIESGLSGTYNVQSPDPLVRMSQCAQRLLEPTRAEVFQPSPAATDVTWKQSKVLTTGWNTFDFDDSSWSAAVDEGQIPTAPWGNVAWPSRSPSHWIWSYDSRSAGDTQTLYFRKTFVATKSTYTVTMTADNSYTAYLNGATVGTGASWPTPQTFTLSTSVGANYVLAVSVTNAGGPGGLIADVR
jgi:hypothetical protein